MALEERVAVLLEMKDSFTKQAQFMAMNIKKLGQSFSEAQSKVNSFSVQWGKDISQRVIGSQRQLGMQSRQMKKDLENTGLDRITAQANTFGRVLGMNFENWKMVNKTGREFPTVAAQNANKFRLLTHGLRGFRMEMLGVMFFGMSMQRLFMGLLQPSLELVGAFELFSDALGILFLPVALDVLEDFAIPFLNWVTSIPEPLQRFIGWLVLGGAVLGALLFVVGTLALGLGSLELMFTATGGAAGVAAAGFGVLGGVLATLLLWVGLVIAILFFFKSVWDNNIGNIQENGKLAFEDLGKSLVTFGSLFSTTFTTIGKVITDFLAGDFDKLKKDWDKGYTEMKEKAADWRTHTANMFADVLAFTVDFVADMLSLFKLVENPLSKMLRAQAEDIRKNRQSTVSDVLAVTDSAIANKDTFAYDKLDAFATRLENISFSQVAQSTTSPFAPGNQTIVNITDQNGMQQILRTGVD